MVKASQVHLAIVAAIVVSGSYIYSCSYDCTVKCSSAETLACIYTIDTDGIPTHLSIYESFLLISVTNHGVIRVMSVTGESVDVVLEMDDWPSSILWLHGLKKLFGVFKKGSGQLLRYIKHDDLELLKSSL